MACMVDNAPLILIVGVCASGKTTLSTGLRKLGYNARSLAQEHSISPRIWRRYKPNFLILLDCQFATIKERKTISWGERRYLKQKTTLEDARAHADLIVVTDNFTPHGLVEYVSQELEQRGLYSERVE